MSEEEVVMQREAEVNQLRGDSYGSLSKSLENPPAGSKVSEGGGLEGRKEGGLLCSKREVFVFGLRGMKRRATLRAML